MSEAEAARAGVDAIRLGLATGDRLVVKDALDLDLERAVLTWRYRLADVLGQGTTQGRRAEPPEDR